MTTLFELSKVAETETRLPSPPTDEEKYWYMGRQHRWMLLAQSLSFALIGVSVLRFSLSDTRLLLFLVPFSLFSVALLISLLSSTRGKRVDRVDHEMRVLEYAPDSYPTVDIFLPSAGEPMRMLANTYHHVRNLRWPADVNVYVLDDSARPEVAALARQHGYHYLTRPNRGFLKKAGNLRYGYEHSTGDLITIFDADFVPRPDFLTELVPYFDEPQVGIVQSPQFFDARKDMHWLQRTAGATQELFYRWIQPARDRSRAAICVGTCAVYRREALDAAGGFAQIGHSEDVHTGVNLMKAGYGLRYIPIIVSKGLCPDTVGAFLNQQYRWCTGSMSLLKDKTFHAAGHISSRQRLCFWAGFLYYITTAVNVFLTALPAMAMIWLVPRYVYPANSRFLLGALVMWLLILPIMFKARWRIDVLRIQTLYSFAHAVAIFDIVTGRTKEWVATGAANSSRRSTPLATTVLRVAKTWIALTMSGIWVGLAWQVHQYGVGKFWAMIAFAALAAYIQVPILFLKNPVAKTAPSIAKRTVGRLVPSQRTVVLPDHPDYGPPSSLLVRARTALRTRAEKRPELAVGSRMFRPDIQGLRAIAVSLVVLYHAHVPGINGGYVGVDVFFVISGFLITGNLMRQVANTGRIRFIGFYAGRFKRLAVPAAIVVVVTLLAVRAWDSIFQVRAVTVDAIWASFYGINYHLANEGVSYQQASGPPSPLQHFWSLAVEEQFYIFWPLLIMLCVWIFRRFYRPAVFTLILAISGVSLYYCIHLTTTNQPMAYFSIHTRAWELGLGALIALGATQLSRMPGSLAAFLGWAGIAGIITTGLQYNDLTVFPGTNAILPVAATGLVIASGCRQSRYSAEILLNRTPMQGIGKVSYAWYLWHWPLLIIFPMKLGYSLSWPAQLEVAILGMWLGVLTLYLVETPIGRNGWQKPAWMSIGPLIAVGTATLAFVIATTVPPLVGTGKAVTIQATNTGGIIEGVAKGTLTVGAPANMVPSLTATIKDQPASSANGCHADFLVVQQGACVYGDPNGTHTMILIGDSHAQQWLPGLDIEAKAKGWKLIAWTKAACPIADVTVHAEQLGNRVFSECNDWRRITLGKIEGIHPDMVFVAQSDSVPGKQFTNAEWADATARTLTSIRAVGTPVYFMMDTPVPRVNIPDCVANNLAKVQPCMFTRSTAYSFPGRHETMASTLKTVGITTLDPMDWFCMPAGTQEKCPAIVGNMMLYRDASHMSTPYSAYLAPALAAFFVPKKS